MIVATSSSSREPLRLVELPTRPLRADELRVRVRAIGVNPVDWKMREGGPLGTAQRLVGPRGPLVIGIDFAGEVVETGTAVERPRVGDRVVGGTNFARKQHGSYADEVIVRPDQCAELPEGVSFDDAACLPVAGVTAWRWLDVAGIRSKRGARVLVLGASGGVGLFAIQLARTFGAAVVGVCSTRNVPLVTRLGATAIDYTVGDPLEAAAPLGPFDLVLNAMGSAHYPSSACRALLTPEGLLGLVVVRPADYPALLFSRRTKTLLGKPTCETLEPLVAALAKREIEAIIEAKLPLAEAEEAHIRSRAGKVVGKLLLVP
jgi:NADPH:quinone reductase-like Zn-dependent oxidoreductase